MFRLHSIVLADSQEFEKAEFDFIKEDKLNLPYTTLVIGSNGTGKSRLLKIIMDIFNDLHNAKEDDTYIYKFREYYKVIYSIGRKKYIIENNREQKVYINGRNSTLYEIELPAKGIIAAYSLHEKFTPTETSYLGQSRKSRYNNEFYTYLGLKTSRNYTFSSANINRSLDLITSALADDNFEKDLTSVFKILGYIPKISITYQVKRNRELFSGGVTKKNIRKLIDDTNYQKSGFAYGALQSIKQVTEPEVDSIVDSLNYVYSFSGPYLKIPIDLYFDDSKNIEFKKVYNHISTLRKFNLINYANISVYKKSKNEVFEIDLRSMSSGEIQVLTSFLALASVVSSNNLVLIDEPEISLHPNWQLQYIDVLNKIFRKCKSCHFIIASHSHLIASDIPPNSSSILSLVKNSDDILETELLDSPFGYSAENILYNIFGVATVRNYYFEKDIDEILILLSKRSKNKKRIMYLLNKFSKYRISNGDPLNVIIKDAKKYLESL